MQETTGAQAAGNVLCEQIDNGRRLAEQAKDWFSTTGVEYLANIAMAAVIFLVGWLVIRLIDAALRKALEDNIADSVRIIVAQRVGTILNAEQIIVLDEGRIAGKGTHAELMKSCSIYQDIARSQLSERELEAYNGNRR